MEERVLLQSNCSLYRVTTKEELDSFSCGDEDLDDFFHQEACLYDGQLLGKMYYVFMQRMASNSCTQQKNYRKKQIIFLKMNTWSQG